MLSQTPRIFLDGELVSGGIEEIIAKFTTDLESMEGLAVILGDVSASTSLEGRFLQVKSGVNKFSGSIVNLRVRKKGGVVLITFGQDIHISSPCTVEKFKGFPPNLTPSGGTPYGEAIFYTQKIIESYHTARAGQLSNVICAAFFDGGPNDGWETPVSNYKDAFKDSENFIHVALALAGGADRVLEQTIVPGRGCLLNSRSEVSEMWSWISETFVERSVTGGEPVETDWDLLKDQLEGHTNSALVEIQETSSKEKG